MKRLIILSPLIFFVLVVLPVRPGLAQEELPQQGEGQEEVYAAAEGKPAASPRGEPSLVTLDFEDADLRDVIRVIAMASGLNMVIGQDVEAKVTISLKEMRWERALDVILRTYNFTYKKEENLIRIMTFEKVKQEERDIPLTTKIIYLDFADVNAMKSTLSKSLSGRGSIGVNGRTNSMVVTDILTKVEEVEKIAATLDTRTPQVMIEAMLVDVKLAEDEELGINWNMVHVDKHKEWYVLDEDIPKDYMNQSIDITNVPSAIEFGWLRKFGTFRIDGLIKAWAEEGKAKILASPKVLTLDNQQAMIEIILEIPYVSDMGEQGNVSYSFKEVGTKLYVTPHISSGGFVSMNLKPELSYSTRNTTDGQPIIDTRRAETNVLVKDGETIVIGGLRRIEDTKTYTKVPFLGDIPFLGRLFRKEDSSKIDTELLMFVTPHIVVKPHIKPEEYEKFKWLDEMTSEKKKKGKKQAMLMEPEITEEIQELPSLSKIKKEENEGYIYSW